MSAHLALGAAAALAGAAAASRATGAAGLRLSDLPYDMWQLVEDGLRDGLVAPLVCPGHLPVFLLRNFSVKYTLPSNKVVAAN